MISRHDSALGDNEDKEGEAPSNIDQGSGGGANNPSPTIISIQQSPSSPNISIMVGADEESDTTISIMRKSMLSTFVVSRPNSRNGSPHHHHHRPASFSIPPLNLNQAAGNEEKIIAIPPVVPQAHWWENKTEVALWLFAILAAHQSSIWALPAPDNKSPSEISYDWFFYLATNDWWMLTKCVGNYALSTASNAILIKTNTPKAWDSVRKIPDNLNFFKSWKTALRTLSMLVMLVFTAMAAFGIGFSGFEAFAGFPVALVIGAFSFISNFNTRTPSVDKCLKNPPNPLDAFSEDSHFQKDISNLLYRMEDNPEVNQLCGQLPVYRQAAKEKLQAEKPQIASDELEHEALEQAVAKVLRELGEKYPQSTIILTDSKESTAQVINELRIRKRNWQDDILDYIEIGAKAIFVFAATTAIPTFTQKCIDGFKVFFPSILLWSKLAQISFGLGAGAVTWALYDRSGRSLIQRTLDIIRLTNDPWADFLAVTAIWSCNIPTSSSMYNTLKSIINNPDGIFPWQPGSLTADACLYAMRVVAWAVNANSAMDHFIPSKANLQAPKAQDIAYLLADPERVRLSSATINENTQGLRQYSLFSHATKPKSTAPALSTPAVESKSSLLNSVLRRVGLAM
jgi:hypothetical protein